MLDVSGVEWIAMRLPPPHPWIACGDFADRARMQQPYGPAGSPVSSRSVTEKLPVGVGASGRPIATVYCFCVLPLSRTVSWRLASDTLSSQDSRPSHTAERCTHPNLPLPARVLTTPSQLPLWARTHSASGDPNSVLVVSFANVRPPGDACIVVV